MCASAKSRKPYLLACVSLTGGAKEQSLCRFLVNVGGPCQNLIYSPIMQV